MRKSRSKLDIHLVGPLPPPFGGVSVHIMRLRERLLKAAHGCTVWGNHHRPEERLFALRSILWRGWRQLSRLDEDAILHFHAQGHLLAGLLERKHAGRVLFTVHNERINHDLTGGRFPKQWLFRKIAANRFRRVSHLLAVSGRAKDELVRFGVDQSSISVINAYLRPSEDETAHPRNLEEFQAFRRRFSVVAAANAAGGRLYRGEDLYGIDMCVDVLHKLKGAHPEFGIALALPRGRGTAYLAALQGRAKTLDVLDRIVWLLEPGAFYPILRRCNLFLRPTNTDGFSISIAESFEHGLPVVASDAVPRPRGCLVFRNRDVDDFASKVSQAITEAATWSQRSLASREPDHFQQILSIYEALAG